MNNMQPSLRFTLDRTSLLPLLVYLCVGRDAIRRRRTLKVNKQHRVHKAGSVPLGNLWV